MPSAKRTSLVTPPTSGKQTGGCRRVVLPLPRCGDHRRDHGRRRAWIAGFLVALLAVLAGSAQTAAQQPDPRPPATAPRMPVSPPLAAKLTASSSTAAVAKPLRESLSQIAASAQINLWIDRRVDPDLAVTIPAGSKSVFQTIAHAARSVGLQAAAADNVVLVGRPQWVTTLAGAILALPPELSQSSAAAPIQWPELTTPSEAIKIVAAAAGADTLALPHDLWPAVAWRDISAPLAMLLITAQFDQMPIIPADDLLRQSPAEAPPDRDSGGGPPADIAAIGSDAAAVSPAAAPIGPDAPAVRRDAVPIDTSELLRPLEAPETLVISYPYGPYLPQLRAAASAADPQSRFRTGRPGGPLQLSGSPAAHVAAAAVYLSHLGAKAAPAPGLDSTRFPLLRLRDAPAKDVFAQLAATAGRRLQITDAASAACQSRVTWEARDATLRELVDRIAADVGVSATWTDQTLRIDPAGGGFHPPTGGGKVEAHGAEP